jgi:hypothetical protein
MRDAGFDVSFRDCPAKGGPGGHPNVVTNSETSVTTYKTTQRHNLEDHNPHTDPQHHVPPSLS